MSLDTVEIVKRLDRVVAILQLAYRAEIEQAKAEIRADGINAAILDQTADDWSRSGDIQREVSRATGASTRTVRSRLQDLLLKQAIEQRGAGAITEYRSTGLV